MSQAVGYEVHKTRGEDTVANTLTVMCQLLLYLNNMSTPSDSNL